ncbi:MAG: hypothetical protein V4627_03195 [Pseudomonadota bacterium]
MFTATSDFSKILTFVACLFMLPAGATVVRVADADIERDVGQIAAHLSTLCPKADAASQTAFDACRKGMFTSGQVHNTLSSFTLWGRQKDPNVLLKDAALTQLAPDALAGMYMPLFMFDGSYSVSYSEQNGLYLARLGVGFRNRLQPGQFPYPFWHESNKWNTYQNAKAMLFWIDPKSRKARAVQFTQFGEGEPVQPVVPTAPPSFDGKWLWTDAQGKTQPAATLFDGLFADTNPHKQGLETSYRALALSLRESQCLQCHVPSNPNRSSKLVLLQSPAHAAAEIKRLLKQVQGDRMPVDEFGLEESLTPHVKALLLERGREFEQYVDKAHAWERAQTLSSTAAVGSVR